MLNNKEAQREIQNEYNYLRDRFIQYLNEFNKNYSVFFPLKGLKLASRKAHQCIEYKNSFQKLQIKAHIALEKEKDRQEQEKLKRLISDIGFRISLLNSALESLNYHKSNNNTLVAIGIAIVSLLLGFYSLFNSLPPININVQFLFNTLFLVGTYILIGISFGLIYESVRFFHFAHAVVFTSGAYFAFLFHIILGLPLYFAIPLACMGACLLGCMMEVLVYKPLRKRGSSSLILLLASLGLYIFLQNLISMIFGDDTKSIRTWPVIEGNKILGARITDVQIIIIVSSIVLVALVAGFLALAKTGKAMRAVANNKELANISGINSNKIILISFGLGSALAGIAGILVALDIDMTPTMGMNALMMGVVAMIVGGVGSIRGIALGALLLALAQNLGVWYISSQWQDAIAFAILLIFLLFKPEGFFGKKVKKTEI